MGHWGRQGTTWTNTQLSLKGIRRRLRATHCRFLIIARSELHGLDPEKRDDVVRRPSPPRNYLEKNSYLRKSYGTLRLTDLITVLFASLVQDHVLCCCKHHLYLDVNPETGSIKLNFPTWRSGNLKTPVRLMLPIGAESLEEVGEILNLTRERIRGGSTRSRKLRERWSQDFLLLSRSTSAD